MTTDRLACTDRVLRGPRAGERCGKTAVAIVVAPIHHGMLVCGNHRRGWLPSGLARIAYWNRKTGGWA